MKTSPSKERSLDLCRVVEDYNCGTHQCAHASRHVIARPRGLGLRAWGHGRS